MDYTSSEAGERLKYLRTRCQEIVAVAEARDGQSMTEAEQREFDEKMAEADKIANARRDAAKPEGMHGQPSIDEPALRFRTPEGKEIRALRPNERMGSPNPMMDGLDAGKYLRGIITGEWRGADAERRAASEGTLSAGGYLVPTPLANFVIDRARNAAVCFQAGALTLPMDVQTLKIARVAQSNGDIATAWMAENAAQTATDGTYEAITLSAHVLSALAKFSIELVEDAPNLLDLVVRELGRIIALEMDRAGLEGAGTGAEPAGILNQSGVAIDSTTFGTNGSTITGTTPTGAVAWDWLSKAIYAVRQLNEYPNAAIYHERTASELDLLRASTGVFLPPPPSVADLANGRLTTNSVSIARTQGSANTASNAYVGDFRELLFGIRNALTLEISREASDSSSSAFANRQVFVRAYGRFDVAVMRPAAFRVVEGIL